MRPRAAGAADYAGRSVVVAGARVAGVACAQALLRLGARVTVIERTDSDRTEELAGAGARIVIADEPPAGLLDGVDDVVVSPGFPPHHPLVVSAAAAGAETYSEPELAWRLRRPDAPPWLGVTGTNGKTTTVTMLAAMLRAGGRRTAALGNIGVPLVDAANDPAFDVLAVELSSFQLHWSSTLAPQAGALLNLADDHLEWHGTFDAYATAKLAIWRGVEAGGTAVGNLDDPRVRAALEAVPGRRTAFTLGMPPPGCVGVVDGTLVDRTGGGDPTPLCAISDVHPRGPHNVANALAAAALALTYGVPTEAVGAGLAGYTPQPHRNAPVATIAGVRYVDDSKATNPHAALASLAAYQRIVWVAGGQLKGVDVNDLVGRVGDRLVAAVLIGVDRAEVGRAIARHAPEVPVVEVARTDDGAMTEAVTAAARLARPGDTVLLAPAAASLDMYRSYAHRGEAFAAAVAGLGKADAGDGA